MNRYALFLCFLCGTASPLGQTYWDPCHQNVMRGICNYFWLLPEKKMWLRFNPPGNLLRELLTASKERFSYWFESVCVISKATILKDSGLPHLVTWYLQKQKIAAFIFKDISTLNGIVICQNGTYSIFERSCFCEYQEKLNPREMLFR